MSYIPCLLIVCSVSCLMLYCLATHTLCVCSCGDLSLCSVSPENSTWLTCPGYTYHPHSNECGPRSLLSIAIMAFHPAPHPNILIPYMHPNISQISRWWVAKSIIDDTFDRTTFQLVFSDNHHDSLSLNKDAQPFDLAPLCHHVTTNSPLVPHEDNDSVSLDQHMSHETSPSPSLPITTPKRYSPTLPPLTATVFDQHYSPSSNPAPNYNQRKITITHWTSFWPFIPNVPVSSTLNNASLPSSPHQIFTDHLTPFGTPLPLINPLKTLRVIFQYTQHSFQLFGDAIDMSLLIANLQTSNAQMFAPISPNINWFSKNNWLRTKPCFCSISQHIHLSAASSDIGRAPKYFHMSLIGGSV
jgi:hypothetical protein